MFEFDDAEGGKKKKKKKDKKRDVQLDGFGDASPAGGESSFGFGGSPSGFGGSQFNDAGGFGESSFGGAGQSGLDDDYLGGSKSSKVSKSRFSDNFGDSGSKYGAADAGYGSRYGASDAGFERRPGYGNTANASMEEDPIASFEAVIAADREVLAHLRQEVDKMGAELQDVVSVGRQLEQEVHQRQQEARRLHDQEQQLLAQVQAAKARLLRAHDEHRGMDHEGMVIGMDRDLIAESRRFFEQSIDDGLRTVRDLDVGNQRLEQHYMELQATTESLEKERRGLAAEVQEEKDMLRQEERQLAELRNAMARRRREVVAATAEAKEAQSREQQLRGIKDGTHIPTHASEYAGGGHSWAHGVASPGVRVARQPLAGGVRSSR